MIETSPALPNGTTLSCRATGAPGRPLMVFLHGFPEAAFIWDELLEHFAQPEHGGFRCIAPNLRGFEQSSSPTDVSAYRAHLLVQDIAELAASENPDGTHRGAGGARLGRRLRLGLRQPVTATSSVGWSSSIRRIRAPSRASCTTTRRSRPPAPT